MLVDNGSFCEEEEYGEVLNGGNDPELGLELTLVAMT